MFWIGVIKMEELKELNQRVCDLCRDEPSEEKQNGLRETIIEIHGLLGSAKSLAEYNEVESLCEASRGLLHLHYQDFNFEVCFPPL